MTGARARRGLVLALAAALTIASLVPVLRIRFETDVLQLMPRESGAVDAFETYLERFGSLDALYVYVEAPADGRDRRLPRLRGRTRRCTASAARGDTRRHRPARRVA